MTGALLTTAAGTGIGIFAAAVRHKILILWHGSAARHPILRTLPRRLTPTAAISAALAGELALIALLIVRPAAGCIACALLVTAYSLRLRHLPLDEDCQCFGAAGNQGVAAAMKRNGLLVAVSAGGGLAGILAGQVDEPLAPAGAVLAVILCAILCWRERTPKASPVLASPVVAQPWPPSSIEELASQLSDRSPIDRVRAEVDRLAVTLLAERCRGCRALLKRQHLAKPQPGWARVAILPGASRRTRRTAQRGFDVVLIDPKGAARLRPPAYPATVSFDAEGSFERYALGRGPEDLASYLPASRALGAKP